MSKPGPKPLTVEYRAVASLIPYARNARTHDDAQVAKLAASMKEFGWTNPILLDGENGVIAGHGRLLAARKLGLETVPCIELSHLTAEQRRAYVLQDNRSALDAGWDDELLRIELADLQTVDYDLSLTGFSADEIAELLASPTKGQTDADDAPEVPVVPCSKTGDLWTMGAHRLLCGDALRGDDLARLMAGKPADLLSVDPPYNVAIGITDLAEAKARRRRTDGLGVTNDSMGDAEFRRFLSDAFKAADLWLRPGACFYIAHADSEGFNFRGAVRDVGHWKLAQCLIWEKDALVLSRQDYHWIHEPILYGWKEGAGHHALADRTQTTVWQIPRPNRSETHPTMKPVELIARQLRNSTKAGQTVLDTFSGSGTTGVAAEQEGRVARLMELDPRYADVGVMRWQAFTGREAVLDGDGRTFAAVKAAREGGATAQVDTCTAAV